MHVCRADPAPPAVIKFSWPMVWSRDAGPAEIRAGRTYGHENEMLIIDHIPLNLVYFLYSIIVMLFNWCRLIGQPYLLLSHFCFWQNLFLTNSLSEFLSGPTDTLFHSDKTVWLMLVTHWSQAAGSFFFKLPTCFCPNQSLGASSNKFWLCSNLLIPVVVKYICVKICFFPY